MKSQIAKSIITALLVVAYAQEVKKKVCLHPLCQREFVVTKRDKEHCDNLCTQAHKQWRMRQRLPPRRADTVARFKALSLVKQEKLLDAGT